LKTRLLTDPVARGVSVLVMAAVSLSVHAQQQESAPRHSSSLGGYYSKGYYDQELPTRVRYLPYTHELSIPNWRFKASLPVLEIAGPGNILVDIGNVGGDPGALVSESGVGDLTLSATWEMPLWSENAPFLDITASLKVPTADEQRGLGTGKPDAGIQVDAYQVIGGFTTFASLGYRYRHRSAVFEGLKDSFNASLGLTRPLGESLQAGLIYDFRQAPSKFSGETHDWLPYLSGAIKPELSLMVYWIEGFTVDSADTALGVQITRRW